MRGLIGWATWSACAVQLSDSITLSSGTFNELVDDDLSLSLPTYKHHLYFADRLLRLWDLGSGLEIFALKYFPFVL